MTEQMFLEEKRKLNDLTEKILGEVVDSNVSVVGFKSVIITLTKLLLEAENITIDEYIETLTNFSKENLL